MSKNQLDETTGHKVAGLTIDVMGKLRSGNLSIAHFEKFLAMSADERGKAFGEDAPDNAILRVISGTEKVMLRARDGSRTIRSSKNVFSYIDSDFKNYGADQKGGKTDETEVVVHEMVKDANFAQMFSSLGQNLDALCMTQDQILEFIEMHRRLLRTEGYGTFFLFKSNDEFFVAGVRVQDGGSLKVHVRRLGDDGVWHAEDRHRVVVPQLAK